MAAARRRIARTLATVAAGGGPKGDRVQHVIPRTWSGVKDSKGARCRFTDLVQGYWSVLVQGDKGCRHTPGSAGATNRFPTVYR